MYKEELLKLINVVDTYDDGNENYLYLDDKGSIFLFCQKYEVEIGGGDSYFIQNLYWEESFDDEQEAKDYWNKNDKDEIIEKWSKRAFEKQKYYF